MKKFFVLFAALLSMTLIAADLAAATVTAGFDPTATLTGRVRYRAFNTGTNAVRVGQPGTSEGFATGFAQGSVSGGWLSGSPPTINRCVQITYDGIGTLTTKVAIGATPCVFTSTLANVSKSSLTLGTLNYLEITIVKNNPTTSVALNGVSLGVDNLGSFAVPNGPGVTRWNVTGIDLTAGFTLEGRVAVSGLSGGGDSNFVQVDVGFVEPEDEEGPITSNVEVNPQPVILNGEGTVTATVDDSTTGGNTISSADYSLNGGADTSMDAQDGAFDEVAEDVEATFTATQLGENEVCVYGTDSANNVGDPTCQSFCVTYSFDGFFTPIDNNFVNIAKAGQAVPAKWRLTDANGVPIDDPESFVGLFSYLIDCEDLQGDPTDAIEEIASGSSGLQYDGDGFWQFNWKTPKSYAGTCRAMYVQFNGCASSPVATFKFKN